MPEASRPVSCPYCATGYLLPETLLGAAGARVKCPACSRTFVVSAAGTASPLMADGSPAPAVPPGPVALPQDPTPPAAGDDAVAVAFEIVEAFASGREELIAQASRDGRFFAEYGAEVIAAFDAYKQRVGRDANPAPFRQLLLDRWGVDLTLPPDPET
jgi:predicted Zn finger-like uncharacterized protein